MNLVSEDEELIRIDDDLYEYLKDTVIYLESYRKNEFYTKRYVVQSFEINGKVKKDVPLRNVVYYLKTGHITKQGVDGLAYRSRDKKDNRFSNIKCHPWLHKDKEIKHDLIHLPQIENEEYFHTSGAYIKHLIGIIRKASILTNDQIEELEEYVDYGGVSRILGYLG